MESFFLLDVRLAPRISKFFRESGGIQVLAPWPPILPVEAEDSPCRAELKVLAMKRHLQGNRFAGPLNKVFPGFQRIRTFENPQMILTVKWDSFQVIRITESNCSGEWYDAETSRQVLGWLQKGARIYGYAEDRLFPEYEEVRIFVPVDALSLSSWMQEEDKRQQEKGRKA
jgi:hypothetical protein